MDRRRLPAPGRVQGPRDRQGPEDGCPRDARSPPARRRRRPSGKSEAPTARDAEQAASARSRSRPKSKVGPVRPTAGRDSRRNGRARGAGQGRQLGDRRPHDQPDQPRQGALSGRTGRRPVHEARPDPLLRRPSRPCCCRTCATAPSTCGAGRTASPATRFWQKQIPHYAPKWIAALGLPRGRLDPSRTPTSSPTASRRWPGWPTTPRSTCTRGRRASTPIATRPTR